MMNQETKNALRKAMYEDADVFYDFFTGKWEEDAFEEAKEAVPGITKEEFDQYRTEDGKFIAGIMKIVLEANKDEKVFARIFDANIDSAYEAAAAISGDTVSLEDFRFFMENGGKPFFKAFEIHAEDQVTYLDEDELEEVVGGISDDEVNKIIKYVLKWVKGCFVADSLVDTPKGARPIQDIKVGDIVYSLDKEGNKVEAEVLRTTVADEDIIEVDFANGKKWTTTSTQWFYDGNKFYDIWQHNGHDVIDLDGITKVENITETGRKEKVYDMTVEGLNIMLINGIAAEGYGV